MNDLLTNLSGGAEADTGDGYSARDIEVLEGLEPVRRRPGMYIGGTDEAALHHLAAEILDNAMDEAVAGHASSIEVALEAGNWLSVRDNGRGIPVDAHPKFKHMSALEVILTTLHSGGKFGGKAYATSGGLHGVGSSVVNALSDEMEVEVARDRVLWRVVTTPADLEYETRSVGGSIYGSSSNGARSAFLRPANASNVEGLFLVGGSSHPGGGIPLVGMSAAIVADLVGPAGDEEPVEPEQEAPGA